MDKTIHSILQRPILGLLGITIYAAAMTSTTQAQQPLKNTEQLCSQAIEAEEHRSKIPTRLLAAIASVESGRWDKNTRANVAWPWTVMAEGKGKFYPDRDSAIQAVENLRHRGISNIDVGCMQINLAYHPDAFKSLLNAFDPEMNVAYAASFLKELRAQKRSWQRAVRFYHSSDPKRQQRYGTKVYKARNAIRAREVKQRRLARLEAIQARRDLAASRKAVVAANKTSATAFTIYQPRSYREQRQLENRARNWAFSTKRR